MRPFFGADGERRGCVRIQDPWRWRFFSTGWSVPYGLVWSGQVRSSLVKSGQHDAHVLDDLSRLMNGRGTHVHGMSGKVMYVLEHQNTEYSIPSNMNLQIFPHSHFPFRISHLPFPVSHFPFPTVR